MSSHTASAGKRASAVLSAASAEKRASAGKNWTALFSFTEDYQHASDVMVANHFTASNPSSPFVGRLVVMSRDVDCRRRLVGRRLAYLEPGKPGHERRLTDTGIVDALRTEFGLSLSKTDNRALLSILADARNDV
ncbi:MAG: arylamine N-acetyltransferase [Kutzneria sp.]|nr:arylamine N-acetyltransferase [Kutzneria sp.]